MSDQECCLKCAAAGWIFVMCINIKCPCHYPKEFSGATTPENNAHGKGEKGKESLKNSLNLSDSEKAEEWWSRRYWVEPTNIEDLDMDWSQEPDAKQEKKWMITIFKEEADQFIATQIAKAKQEGRNEVLREMRHDQQKFLDGFAHPKDCKECRITRPNQ